MAGRYRALLDERGKLTGQIDDILNKAESEGRAILNEDEAANVKALETKLDVVADQLAIEERRRERERTLAPIQTDETARVTQVHDRALDKPWGQDTGAPFGEFLQAVHRARMHQQIDPRLFQAAAQGAGEAVDSDGGYLVDMDRANDLMIRITQGQVLSRVDSIPISANSNGITINTVAETDRATGSRFGGVRGYWLDEGGTITPSRPKFHRIELKLKKLAALGYATDELLQDAAALERVMTTAFEQELRFLVEDALINGDGSGKPQGILNAPALVSVAKETGQAAATVVKENVDKIWSRMWAPSRGNAVWFINQDIEPQLDNMSMAIGTGGVPVYLPPGGLAETPFARLKGRPVIPIEYAATLGTVGDIILADMSQYAYITKGGVRQASSIHVAFTTDEMAFRATMRVDGQAKWKTVLTPFKGTGNTQAPFVVLATRS